MITRHTPPALHEVLGERFVPTQLATMLGFAALAATFVIVAFADLAPWRLALAWLLVADIAAGCLANFTRSTNDFYAARPGHRWLFIAAHVHLLAVAWLLQIALPDAGWVWAYTIASAAVVNLLHGHASARFVAAALLGGAVLLIGWIDPAGPIFVLFTLFYLKVAFAFALDHVAPADAPLTVPDGLIALGPRDRRAASAVIAASFQHDPLFVRVVGERVALRVPFAAYLFDMVGILGGSRWGWFEGGRLSAVMLLERRGAPSHTRAVLAALHLLPLVPRIGLDSARWLNRYALVTHASGPDAPHHYLTLLAVAPHAQGRGLGRRMVAAAWSQTLADPASKALALDTENQANVALYQHLGFTLTTETAVEALPVFAMTRSAAGTPA